MPNVDGIGLNGQGSIKQDALEKEILDNHQKYLERIALFKSYGYDVEKERGFILDQANPLEGKILDAGTGKGYFALALAKEGHSFVTIDISEEEQHYAKLNLAYYGVDNFADFMIENAEHTSFPDGTFDIIFFINVIHHLSDPYLVVKELIRILSPKGKLVLADFTESGFMIVDKVQALEGKTHETGKVNISDIELYLKTKGFFITKIKSSIQEILIAKKVIC
jgi:2-polyprenyl-3-methyl-5-hydroxy-6-metoxy-1,4-benzoquinol methylase